jgi:ParB/RepB/Spo0J family partition protein
MQIELSQLELTYAALRISQPAAQSQLIARLCAVGQQSPVVVVAVDPPAVPERFVLIDGYRRVEALRQLGNDTVEAVVLALPAADALLWHRRQDASRRRTALEDGWLLRELREQHGISGVEIARRLGRSSSWVSRRLSLVDTLPVSGAFGPGQIFRLRATR